MISQRAGVSEPYRMFTSRAEYRLSLRADNAELRLTPIAIGLGCVSPEREAKFSGYFDSLSKCLTDLKELNLTPNEAARHGLALNRDGLRRSAFQLLSYPEVSLDHILSVWPELLNYGGRVLNAASVDAAYAVYLDRQQQDIAQRQKEEARVIPADFDYGMLGGLSNELKQKLERVRPPSIGHAERIEGMTPAAIALLLSHLRRGEAVRPVTLDRANG
jgi:tRNA uridine 5-carboxymethylaminomethyl modification enzyme